MNDVVTIGSATVDIFVETDDARIVSVATKDASKNFMAYPYGSKMEIDDFSVRPGGGGVNTGMNFANLGLKTSIICKTGDDFPSDMICKNFKENNVDTSNIIKSKKYSTGFSVILTSFEGDRTVLAHRGANAKIKADDIDFDAIKKSKWLYLAPLNGDTNKIIDKLSDFAEENGVNLAINLGTTSIKMGKDHLQKVLKTAEVIVMNKEEAVMLSRHEIRPDTKTEKFSQEFIHPDLKEILLKTQHLSKGIVLITDGKNGVYATEGKNIYKCPEFPAKVVSTLGAGDSFASTFVATIEKYNGDIKRALEYASVNAASVVSHFGAQEGFLTFNEIEKRLKETPDFSAQIIKI